MDVLGKFSTLSSVILGRNVNGDCFSNNKNLKNVSFQENSQFTRFNTGMFNGCSITSVMIPQYIESIPDNCFYGCPINSLTIPSYVNTIGKNAFTNIEELVLKPSEIELKVYGQIIDGSISQTLNRVCLDRNVNGSIAKNCKNLSQLNIGEHVTFIPEKGFEGSTIYQINIPSNVTEVRKSAFENCSTKWVECHSKSIKERAFYGCTNLMGVKLVDVEDLGEMTFANCDKLSWLNMGDKMRHIGNDCLKNCSSLTTLGIQTETPPSCDGTLGLTNTWGINVYVPLNSAQTYSKTSAWDALLFYNETSIPDYSYSSQITLKKDTKDMVFSGNITSAVIKEINDNTNIETLDLRNAIVGESVSGDYYYSEGKYYPENTWSSVDVIRNPGRQSLYTTAPYNRSTTTTTSYGGKITNYITTYYCNDLSYAINNDKIKKLYLPNSLKSLGKSAIRCYWLEDIYVQDQNPITCDNEAFTSIVYSDATLHVPEGCVAEYRKAAGWNKFSKIVSDGENSQDNKIRILEQPSCKSPKIRLADENNASYQWYRLSTNIGEDIVLPINDDLLDLISFNFCNDTLSIDKIPDSATAYCEIKLPYSIGDAVSFDYDINTEERFDQIIVQINDNAVSTFSGLRKGNVTYTLPNDSNNVLRIIYVKDERNTIDNEYAIFTNIKLITRNLEPIVGENNNVFNRSKCSLGDIACCIASNKESTIRSTFFEITDNSQLELVVYTKSGCTAFGFTDRPIVRFEDTKFTITTSNGENVFELQDVYNWKFNIEGKTPTSIEETLKESSSMLKVVNNEIKAEGLSGFECLQIFDISGKMISSTKPDSFGIANINIENLPAGIYVVRAGSNSIKITKR